MEQSDVFVSYRRSDVEFTKQLVKALQSTGREVWVDWEDIPPGVEGFSDEIQRGIEATDAFIAILSPAYLQSPYCLMELREALRLKKRVVPVVVQKFEPEPPPEGIAHINWVYFTPHAGQENTFEESFPRVVEALEADHEHARTHTRLLTRAIEWEKREHEKSYLLTGTEIDQAEGWQVQASMKSPSPTELQLNYIFDSRKQQRIQQRRFTISIGVLLVLAVITGVYAVYQAYQANISAQINYSNSLASAALQSGNEDIAVALALESVRSKHAPENAYRTLAQVVDVNSIRYLFKTDEDLSIFMEVLPAISPDGESVVVRNQLYDAATGHMVREFEDAPKLTIAGLFFSDGKRVVLAGDRDVEEHSPDFIYLGIYDVDTGKLLQKFDTGIGVSEVQLSADENTLVAYQPDGKAVWWDVQSGKRLREFELFTVWYANCFSPDLKWMAATRQLEDTGEFELVITNTQTGQVQQIIPSGEYATFRVRFSNDSKQFAMYAGQLTTFSVETGEALVTFSEVPYSITSIRYSPDNTSLVATGLDQTVMVLDSRYGTVIKTQTAHRDALIFADYVHGGDRVISVDATGVVMNWDIFPGNMERGPVVDGWDGVAVVPDGRHLIHLGYSPSGDIDHFIIRDANTLEAVSSVYIKDIPPETSNTSIDITLCDYYLEKTVENGLVCYVSQPWLITEEGGYEPAGAITVHVASLTNGEILRTWQFDAPGSVQAAKFSSTGDMLYISYTDENSRSYIDVRNIADGSVIKSYATDYDGALDFALSPDNTRLLIGKATYNVFGLVDSGSVQLIDVSNDDVLFTLDIPIPEWMFFTPDNTQFVIARSSEYGKLKSDVSVYDSKTGSIIHEYTLDVSTWASFDIQPETGALVTNTGGGGGGTGASTPSGIVLGQAITMNSALVQWNFITGEQIRRFPENMYGSNFSADGKRMFSYSDGRIVVWNFISNRELIEWACANRYVPEFTEQQRERFNIENDVSLCSTLED